jgi:hypothetical protein
MLLASLATLLPREPWRVFLMTPATLLRWRHPLAANRFTCPPTGRARCALPE